MRYEYDTDARMRLRDGGSRDLRVHVARRFADRLIGLMGSGPQGDARAVLFERTRSIHTMWMRRAIDLVWLARENCYGFRPVVQVRRADPWRVFLAPRDAAACLELDAGEASAAVALFCACSPDRKAGIDWHQKIR